MFHQGRGSTSDEQRSGRPISVRTDMTSAVIEQLMDYSSDDENERNKADPVPTSSKRRNIMKSMRSY
ncbi:hypothetical protein TNCV_630441 [Trichonephila clavipes]|nr:hypothetical protein TNCV_630441 [Trichonephila clavipes]